MRRTPALVLAAAVLAGGALAHPASAGGLKKAHPLVVKDARGDATPVAAAKPLSQPDADILSFSLYRKDNGTKVIAWLARIDLAAPPSMGHDYQILMSAPGCSTYAIEFEYPPDPSGTALPPSAYLRENCNGATGPTSSTFDNIVDYTIVGKSILFRVPVKGLPGGVHVGTELAVKSASVRGDEGAFLVGTFDTATPPPGTFFTVGQ